MKQAAIFATVGAVLASCATAPAGPAPAPAPTPTTLIDYFDADSVGSVLDEMGAVWQARQAANGQPYIEASLAGELNLVIVPTACQGAGFTQCVGMNTVSVLTGAGFNPQTVAAFNQRYPFSSVGLWVDGRDAYISRYEICDYGIPRGNVEVSIASLAILAARFREELSTSRMTVSLEGYAGDLSSRYLNEKTLEAFGGKTAEDKMARHAEAIEESLEFVRAIVRDAGAPRNKVQNINAQ